MSSLEPYDNNWFHLCCLLLLFCCCAGWLVVVSLRSFWCPFLLISIELMERGGSYACGVAFIVFCGWFVVVPLLFHRYLGWLL
jgi:hypothetical protein